MAEKPSQQRRNIFRYSLRTLLAIVTAFCVWLGVGMQRARVQKSVVEAMERNGVAVFYDFQLKNFAFGNAPPQVPNDAGLWTNVLGVDFFHGVDTVLLSDSAMDVGDAPSKLQPLDSSELAQLNSLPTLRSIRVDRRVTPNDLRSIAQLDNLETLVIGEYAGDEETLARIRQDHAHLKISVLRVATDRSDIESLPQ